MQANARNVMTQLAAKDTQSQYITFVSDKISLLDQMILSMPHIRKCGITMIHLNCLKAIFSYCSGIVSENKRPGGLHMCCTPLHVFTRWQGCHAQRCKIAADGINYVCVQISTKQVTNITGQWFHLVSARWKGYVWPIGQGDGCTCCAFHFACSRVRHTDLPSHYTLHYIYCIYINPKGAQTKIHYHPKLR